MQDYQTILIDVYGVVATITLNRPEVHNAINIQMIRELTLAIKGLEEKSKVRFVVLTSSGKNFSSGADLIWMRDGMEQTREQLKAESMELAGLFRTISESELICLTAVRGKVMGGANGLVAVSDMVMAEDTSSFTFSEVKLGLIPATIAPYVLKKAGFSKTTELMLSGRTFEAKEAMEAGLVNYICKKGTLQERTDQIMNQLAANGPAAMKGIKKMISGLSNQLTPLQVQEYTAEIIARQRISKEGQEGMKAFLEKRNPDWDEAD